MFEPTTPDSKLYPKDDGRDLDGAREKYAELLLDTEDEWQRISETIYSDIELNSDIERYIKELVDTRRHCQADSSSVRVAVNSIVHVYERAAMKIAKEHIK